MRPRNARPPRPVPGAPRPYRFPSFERHTLENGLRLLSAREPKLPLVTVVVLVDAGAACDFEGREGLARFTARMLLEGTTRMDGAGLIEAFEHLGASVEAQADWDSAAITMTVLRENLEPALALLGEVLRAPAFPEREVERLRAERLAELLQLRAEPRGLADELFTRFVYQPASRYSRPEGGDEASVAAISRDDLQRFFRERYVASNATAVYVGDISATRAAALTRRTFGDWGAGGASRAAVYDLARNAGPAVHIVTKPDAPQSELRIGHVGPSRSTPDYFAAAVMNAILGGLFNSRINLNLREDHAYTYGAYTAFEWRRQAGPFVVSAAVRSEVTGAAAREVMFEIERLQTTPIARKELSLATSYLDGVFPIRYETTAAIAGALVNLIVHSLPDDYYDRYRERIRAVTIPEVLEAAQRRLRRDRVQTVIVGDPELVRAQVEPLGLGPITVYDTNGNPVE